MNKNTKYKQPERRHKINSEVRFPQVRVIGDLGQGKVMSSFEASKLAQDNEKDLILISETGNTPVVKIEDYGKFLYELEKKEKVFVKQYEWIWYILFIILIFIIWIYWKFVF